MTIPTDTDKDNLEHDSDLISIVSNNGAIGSFWLYYFTTKASRHIFIISFVSMFGFFCTVGVVPEVMTDRYARLYHGHTGSACITYTNDEMPKACDEGSDNAQAAAAVSSFVASMLSFLFGPVVGSISDRKGRRGPFLVGTFLCILSPITLVLVQLFESMNPSLYYAMNSIVGLVSCFTISLSSLSDVMPPSWRAPSYGLTMVAFELGITVAPTLCLGMDHLTVSIISACILVFVCFYAVVFFPETLSDDIMKEASRSHADSASSINCSFLMGTLLRPFRDLSILCRSRFFLILSAIATLNAATYSIDGTFSVYYIERTLDFRDKDIATLFLIHGILGMLVLSTVLKYLTELIGERRVITISLSFAILHNLLYGIAKSKTTIIAASAISAVSAMTYPSLSSLKSRNVDNTEQGQIQGALTSIRSLASALGPILSHCFYLGTKDALGSGSMFIFAALLCLVALVLSCFLSESSNRSPIQNSIFDEEELTEVLLDDESSGNTSISSSQEWSNGVDPDA